ncbi:uncharacterized protein G2W53_000038 [Senna tora]|uniref:Uncharacterized protein n=1 Tax=Senna tora TaxID=362788 RepID=A0A834XH41_9FABA|nr:uncharacterized protein G2W53_000038 [Senna tora]
MVLEKIISIDEEEQKFNVCLPSYGDTNLQAPAEQMLRVSRRLALHMVLQSSSPPRSFIRLEAEICCGFILGFLDAIWCNFSFKLVPSTSFFFLLSFQPPDVYPYPQLDLARWRELCSTRMVPRFNSPPSMAADTTSSNKLRVVQYCEEGQGHES